ncbi:spore germination protein [Alicyclobacillus sp. SO9]|nr:spore germination protein [Alicyclobacillus sp. SO9]
MAAADGSLDTRLAKNEQLLRKIFTNSSDVVFRKIPLNRQSALLMIYVDGLVDTKTINESLLRPLLSVNGPRDKGRTGEIRQALAQQLVAIADTETTTALRDVIRRILQGNTSIMVEGWHEALIVRAQGAEKRSVDKPDNETSLRGPRDCFTETLRTNTSLLRRRMKNPNLKMELFVVGERTRTDVVIAYLGDLVVHSALIEVRRRLGDIPFKDLVDSGYIEEYIQDSHWSPWPQVQNTERPDVATSSILEGKVVIIVDGSPFALIVPMTFWAGLQAADDHYERFEYAVFNRSLRYGLAVCRVTSCVCRIDYV